MTIGSHPKAWLLAVAFALAGCSGGSSESATDGVDDGPGIPPPGGGQPTASLTASDQTVDEGASTTLTWSSTNANECTASGGWSGDKGTSGSEVVGPLTGQTTYSLSCNGDGGNAVVMISVSINGTVNIEWVAPTENTDGSALTDLASFRIYYGDSSRSYDDSVPVNDPNATSFDLPLTSGSYFVAMTAFDADGNESGYSNEVMRSVD